MKEIRLKNSDKVALVDDDDYERLSQFVWRFQKGRQTGYAVRGDGILMHSEVLGTALEVDHVNRNGLDNRKVNLRHATPSQQQANKIKGNWRKFTSKYKGVHFYQNRWQATICKNKKKIYLGRFLDEVDAARAYDRAAIELFGEFAATNFPET